MELLVKKYDRFLKVKKLLDGTIKITRSSPFKTRDFDILTIQNQKWGDWVLKKLYSMDTQRKNIVRDVAQKNRKLHDYHDLEMTRDIVDFMVIDRIVT